MANPFDYILNTTKLRDCQSEAYEAARKHFSEPDSERSIILQLPTGAGKTGLIAAAPFGIARSKVLVLTPSVKLARDIANKLDVVQHSAESEFTKLGLLDDDAIENLDLFVLRLESAANASDIEEQHLIVSNYQQLQDLEKWFQGKQDLVDLIIVDEAHHQAANTYQGILNYFPKARVIGLTATPFRSDGKAIEGKIIYKYPFNRAIKDGVIRNLRVANVAPEGISLSFSDEKEQSYTLPEMLELKEQAWFNRGIALSQDCCDSIARKAKEKLEELRKAFPGEDHQIIAAAISKRHAREKVKPAFEKLDLRVGLVSSADEDSKTNDETFKKLKQGKIDVIIHIGMLGEGFDHPPLGVAAIFRPFKTLNPYIQFIGRVLRRNGPVPHGYIVSHVGLNQLQRFEEFKLFDYEDREFLQTLFMTSADTDVMKERSFVEDDGTTTTATEPLIRERGEEQLEISSQFVPDSTGKVEEVYSRFQALKGKEKDNFLRLLGVDPSSVTVTPQKRITRVRPVDRRKAERSLLHEREKSIATDVLKKLRLKHMGRDFNKRFQNFAWVVKKVKGLVNKSLGKGSGKRREVSNAEYEHLNHKGVLARVESETLEYFRIRLRP